MRLTLLSLLLLTSLQASAQGKAPSGRLKVVSDPAGAKVSIDGEPAGQTPLTQEVEPGSYHLRITMPGFADVVKEVTVEAGREAYDVETFGRSTASAKPLPPLRDSDIVVRKEPRSGLEFVYLTGGSFHYGCEPQDKECAGEETPGRSATVKPFWIGKTDVTVEAYERCVDAGACKLPTPNARCDNRPGKAKPSSDKACIPAGAGRQCNWGVMGRKRHPVNCIEADQAAAFCEWIGGRLPTGEEWEFAAKGGESRIYPWGDDAPDSERACYSESCSGTTSVTAHTSGASRHGLLDMAGNVWQWTASKQIRGGSFSGGPRNLRASNRLNLAPSAWDDGVGVRCAM